MNSKCHDLLLMTISCLIITRRDAPDKEVMRNCYCLKRLKEKHSC